MSSDRIRPEQFSEAIREAKEKNKLPLTITVDYGNSIVDYVLNKNEYRGIIRRKADGRTCDVTHYITFDGFVGPAVSTNRLAQKDPFVRENNKPGAYRAVIDNLLDVGMACLSEVLRQETRQTELDLKLPKWLKLSKGDMSADDYRRATLAGVDLHILDFAENCGYKVTIDTVNLIHRPEVLSPRHIKIEEGEWEDESQGIAKNIRLTPGYRLLAIEDGLKLVSVDKKSKMRKRPTSSFSISNSISKAEAKTLESKELQLGIVRLKEKFNFGN